MDTKNLSACSPETQQLYLGDHIDWGDAYPESFPIYQTSSYTYPDVHAFAEGRKKKGYLYGRINHPNFTSLNEVLARMEQGEAAWVVSSGMFAIFTALITLVKGGDHILANTNIYGETYQMLKTLLPQYGVETTFVDLNDKEAVSRAIRPNTRLFYGEVIANPLTMLLDVRGAADMAHAAGAKLVIDNTYSSPYVVKPLTLGADVVVHSLTKYINGHFDAIGGAIIADKETIERARFLSTLIGGSLAPFVSWLILRGTRSFELRLEKQNRNAIQLAAALEANPLVEKVYHPSLESHPHRELALRLFRPEACGAMLSFSLPEDPERIDRFMAALKMVGFANTLGGFRTTVAHPATQSHSSLTPEERAALGIHYGTIRVSVGIESPEDIIRDFSEAIQESLI
ncbi:aminotransferase class I/II-fold pyridoxal phosphate-dependent enzyme [Bilophila wadsworthia]|uniref:trans-sulfuration enzyme family protein n=1 Tax=Bilophila wadsworthia TaxID=35833 RepID=UPI0032603F16